MWTRREPRGPEAGAYGPIASPRHADENNLFLTFRQRQVTVWNFRGEQVTTFDDHTLWHPDTNTNNIFITAAQDYVRPRRHRPPRTHTHSRLLHSLPCRLLAALRRPWA